MLARVPRWRLPLRAWQRAAFDTWNESRPNDALFVATPGAGKTRFAVRLAHALLEERSVARVIAVVPREHLKAQVARAMAGAGIRVDHRFRNADRALAADVDGAVVTYQQVAAAPRTFRALARTPSLVIFDEIHHAGEQATWGAALREAFDEAQFRVALSGTPFRSDGTPIPFVAYDRGECVPLAAYDYADALRDGVCRALVFPMQGGEAHWISRDGIEMRAAFDDALDSQRAGERLRTALTQPEWLGDVLEKAHLKVMEARALGHVDAGGLIAAMNQEHARFVASVLRARTGVEPQLVVSDLDDASARIAAFSTSRDPWIVAVHMVSEGVDIPRLRVGVFASNVVSELYFRQFCGRFVRTSGDAHRDREAYVYLPDDVRLRAMASAIVLDVRRALRGKRERDEVSDALMAAQRAEPASDEGEYASLAAVARDAHVLDFGPLFNPGALLAPEPEPAEEPAPTYDERVIRTHAETRDALRREIRALVAQASVACKVDHKRLHGTLNARFGGSIATATIAELEGRRRTLLRWLERRSFDG